MSGFKGDVAQFTQAEKDVIETKNAMVQDLNTLRDNIEATQAGWSGPASAAFANVMVRFDEESRNLYQALETIGLLLERAGSKYEAAEEEQLESIQSIARSMEGL